MTKLIAVVAAVALALSGVALGSSGSVRGSDDVGTTTARTTTGVTTNGVEDLSGPCDEAEHRNDPRCSGAAPTTTKASGKGRSGKGRSGKGRSGKGRSGRG
jgi:hypothetical protein